MADLINLQQSEYNPIQTQLKELHETALKRIRSISNEIRNLSQVDGGFYIDKLSNKVDFLLNVLESDILTLVETNFDSVEASISNFANIIANVDTACS